MLLALLAAASAQAPYPLVAVLNEARATCSVKAPLADYRRNLAAKGWKPATPAAGSWLADWIKRNHANDSATNKVTDATFTRMVAGRTLFAYISEIEQASDDGPFHGLSCEIYDFAAQDGVTTAAVLAWAKAKPLPSPFDDSDGIVLQRWVPGLSPAAENAGVHFLPPSDPAKKRKQGLNYSANFTLPVSK
ncbi:MAG: hypothetical protein V4808_09815 [Pseudomonadota bacterium]